MIIERTELYGLFKSAQIGTANSDSLTLYLTFKENKMMCKKVDFMPFIDDFSSFPDIPHWIKTETPIQASSTNGRFSILYWGGVFYNAANFCFTSTIS